MINISSFNIFYVKKKKKQMLKYHWKLCRIISFSVEKETLYAYKYSDYSTVGQSLNLEVSL